ncbi:hypothetical protein GQX73_g987 [Xylaria multiplex]|uniref:Uncharacterized protein n=1 Tax=Xylaria multiplex TaxID=323545 RepID=A0A7C8IWI3_9PEZI|nr:hypothetical protein GQX73_g987 [Xylaria multiplex]
MATQELHFIKKIKVDKVEYPISTNTNILGEAGYFSIGESLVGHSLDGEHPVAVLRDATFTIVLNRPFLKLKAPYSIRGMMNGGYRVVFQQDNITQRSLLTELASSRPGKLFLQTDFFGGHELSGFKIVPPKIPDTGSERRLPWGFSGELTWTLKGREPSPVYQDTTHVNIFVLPPNLPAFFKNAGIPLRLLRHPRFLPTWMNQVEDREWEAFVVDTVFNLESLEYEVWSGIPRYTWFFGGLGEVFSQGKGIACLLDLWLSDLAVLGTQSKIQVNCYDLAAICQVITALGFDGNQNQIYMHYMQPFGYIKATHLIGREEDPRNKAQNPGNWCNNPFYGALGAYPFMLCPQMHPSRRPFGNHAFLSISKGNDSHVLDACCGPQTGATKLGDYADAVIDTVGPYDLTNPFDRPGQNIDILSGVGVDRLVRAQYFVKLEPPRPDAKDIMSRVAQYMQSEYNSTLRQPNLCAPLGTARGLYIAATWSFNLGIDGSFDLVRINILRYSDPDGARNEFDRRVSTVKYWVQSPPNSKDRYADLGGLGSIRMFLDDRHGYTYVAIIEVHIRPHIYADNRPRDHFNLTTELKNELQNILNENLDPKNTRMTYVDNTKEYTVLQSAGSSSRRLDIKPSPQRQTAN